MLHNTSHAFSEYKQYTFAYMFWSISMELKKYAFFSRFYFEDNMLSNYAFHNIPTSKQLEVNKLLEIFKDKIDLEIIESVLINTNYNGE